MNLQSSFVALSTLILGFGALLGASGVVVLCVARRSDWTRRAAVRLAVASVGVLFALGVTWLRSPLSSAGPAPSRYSVNLQEDAGNTPSSPRGIPVPVLVVWGLAASGWINERNLWRKRWFRRVAMASTGYYMAYVAARTITLLNHKVPPYTSWVGQHHFVAAGWSGWEGILGAPYLWPGVWTELAAWYLLVPIGTRVVW